MNTTWTSNGTCMVSLFCWHEGCGIEFAVPEVYAGNARARGSVFHCPNGHRLNFGKSQIELERERAEAAKRLAAFWETRARENRESSERIARRLSAQRGATARLRRRIANGVCPCCQRHFANVARHVAHQHPEFKAAGSEG